VASLALPQFCWPTTNRPLPCALLGIFNYFIINNILIGKKDLPVPVWEWYGIFLY
jgi:hypothetical protein